MKILISPISAAEAVAIASLGVDIIDIKNVEEGSLGAQFPWEIRTATELLSESGSLFSASLGDLSFKPGTASLAAYGAAGCGVDYVKAGLFGLNRPAQATAMMVAIRRAVRMVSAEVLVVASGYADYRRFDGLSPEDLVLSAQEAECDVVMVDTAIKDGSTLFDALSEAEIEAFLARAREAKLQVALAGSLRAEHAERLKRIQPDIIGVRGAVCEATNRHAGISVEKTKAFLELFADVRS